MIDPMDLADVRSALAGDGESYRRLVRRHQQAVAAYLWRFTRDRSAWEELVQTVFVEAYFSLRSYRAQAPLAFWLRKIATRVGYRFWRQRDRAAAVSLDQCDEPARFDRSVDAAEAARIVHAALARLAPRDRLVLTLLYLEGCSVAEASRLSGWSQTMVKVQAHRARKRMEKHLRQWGAEP